MYMKKYTVRKKRTTRRRRRRQNKRNGGLVMPWSRRSNVKPPVSDTKLNEFNNKFVTTEQTFKTMQDKELAERGLAVLYGLRDNTMDIDITTRILKYLEKENIDIAENLLNNYYHIVCLKDPYNPDAVRRCQFSEFDRMERELLEIQIKKIKISGKSDFIVYRIQ